MRYLPKGFSGYEDNHWPLLGCLNNPWRRAASACLRTILDGTHPAVYVLLMSASGGTVSGEGLWCGEMSDSDEESITRALLPSLSRSRTTLHARVATGGCTNFGSTSALLVKYGNGGGAMLRPATPGYLSLIYPESTRALNEIVCVCAWPTR